MADGSVLISDTKAHYTCYVMQSKQPQYYGYGSESAVSLVPSSSCVASAMMFFVPRYHIVKAHTTIFADLITKDATYKDADPGSVQINVGVTAKRPRWTLSDLEPRIQQSVSPGWFLYCFVCDTAGAIVFVTYWG